MFFWLWYVILPCLVCRGQRTVRNSLGIFFLDANIVPSKTKPEVSFKNKAVSTIMAPIILLLSYFVYALKCHLNTICLSTYLETDSKQSKILHLSCLYTKAACCGHICGGMNVKWLCYVDANSPVWTWMFVNVTKLALVSHWVCKYNQILRC